MRELWPKEKFLLMRKEVFDSRIVKILTNLQSPADEFSPAGFSRG